MAAITLDRTDLTLLAELQRAGRQTNAELAERVHLSASACLRRVQRLCRCSQARKRTRNPANRSRSVSASQ